MAAYGNTSAIKGQSVLVLGEPEELYEKIVAAEKAIDEGLNQSIKSPMLKSVAIKVTTDTEIRIGKRGWVPLTVDDRWLTLGDLDNRSIEIKDAGVNYVISYVF